MRKLLTQQTKKVRLLQKHWKGARTFSSVTERQSNTPEVHQTQ